MDDMSNIGFISATSVQVSGFVAVDSEGVQDVVVLSFTDITGEEYSFVMSWDMATAIAVDIAIRAPGGV